MSLNIKYRQLKAFALAVETGSFRVAADRLAVTQPSFSALIRELESDVNVVLFDRSARTAIPTEAGRTFYELIRSLLDHLEEAYQYMKDVGNGSRGRLRIAAVPSLSTGIITDKLAAFQRLHPGVSISLSERTHEQILEAVRHGEVEVGIGSMAREHPDLAFQPLFTDHLMIVAPSGHPLTAKRPVWKSLEKFPLVLLTAGQAEHALKVNNVQTPPAFRVEQAATALAMVRHGMGVSILPSSIVGNLNLDGLTCLPVIGKMARRNIGMIIKRDAVLSTPASAFAKILQQPAPEQQGGTKHETVFENGCTQDVKPKRLQR